MPEIVQEQPLYVLAQNKARAIIPKMFYLIILGIIFYLGILLNISLLDLTAQEETYLKIGSLLVVALLIIAGIIIAVFQARRPYLFYREIIQYGKKEIPYIQIKNINPEKNIADKLFKTYHLNLTEKFSIQNIPQELSLQDYIQKMMTYAMSMNK